MAIVEKGTYVAKLKSNGMLVAVEDYYIDKTTTNEFVLNSSMTIFGRYGFKQKGIFTFDQKWIPKQLKIDVENERTEAIISFKDSLTIYEVIDKKGEIAKRNIPANREDTMVLINGVLSIPFYWTRNINLSCIDQKYYQCIPDGLALVKSLGEVENNGAKSYRFNVQIVYMNLEDIFDIIIDENGTLTSCLDAKKDLLIQLTN